FAVLPECRQRVNFPRAVNWEYRVDESIEQLTVCSVLEGTITVGTQIEVTAVVYTAANVTGRDEPDESDVSIFFYAPDVMSGGNSDLLNYCGLDRVSNRDLVAFWLPSLLQLKKPQKSLRLYCVKAVRLTCGYAEYAIDPCYRQQYWQDIDDCGLRRVSASIIAAQRLCCSAFFPSTIPTTSTNLTSSPITNSNNFLVAVYDASLRAPYCSTIGSSCSSDRLLDGSGSFAADRHRERNAPNTSDSCKGDQEITASSEIKPTYHHD
ncbi:hypothetical protein ACHAWX_003625, partial [Stephanocyclus meneghinianus]